MKVLRAVLTGLLLSLPAIAAAQDVKVDFDKAFDFSKVKTFSMKLGTGWGNDLSQRRVLTEFEEEIIAKGWKKVDEAQANIQVVLHGATQTQTHRKHVLQRHGRMLRGLPLRRHGHGVISRPW